jgi:hypothetical protein
MPTTVLSRGYKLLQAVTDDKPELPTERSDIPEGRLTREVGPVNRYASTYILPVRIDDTEVAGLLPTIGYLNWKDHGVSGLVTRILEKIYGKG